MNKMYPGKIKRYASPELKQFKMAVEIWMLRNRKIVQKAREYFEDKEWIEISCYLCVPNKTIWTLKGGVKTWDASNRIKAIHDAVSKLIDKDDKHFFLGITPKVITTKKPHTIITLGDVNIKTEIEILEEIEQWQR